MGDNQSKPSLDNDLKDDKEKRTVPIWAIVLFVLGGIGLLLIIAIVTMRFLKFGPFRKSDYQQLMEESAGQGTPNCTKCEKSLDQYKNALGECQKDVQELLKTNQEWAEAAKEESLFQKKIKELADDAQKFLDENPRN